MKDRCLLIGDIGGTNARFALGSTDVARFSRVVTLECAKYETAELAIEHYLDEVDAPNPSAICLAAAGPVIEGRVRFTNSHWSLSEAGLAETFEVSAVRLLKIDPRIRLGRQ